MAYSLIAHAAAGSSDGGNSVTTPPIDTTGATLLVDAVSRYGPSGSPTFTDTKANTWNPLTSYASAGAATAERLLYAKNPIVGAGHTVTGTLSGSYPATAFAAFSGADLTAPFDVENGIGTGATAITSIQPGPVTPSVGGELIITALVNSTAGVTATIDSGFTILDSIPQVSGQTFGIKFAYKIKASGDTSAENPTWTFSASDSNLCAVIAAFKPAVAPATPTVPPGFGQVSRLLPMQPPHPFPQGIWTKDQQDSLVRIWQDIAAYVNRTADILNLTSTVAFSPVGVTLHPPSGQGLGVHAWISGRSFVVNLDLVVDIASALGTNEIQIILPFPANNFVIESGTVAVVGYEAPSGSVPQKLGNLSAGFPATSPVGGMTNTLFFNKGDFTNFTTADSPLYIFGQIILPMT